MYSKSEEEAIRFWAQHYNVNESSVSITPKGAPSTGTPFDYEADIHC